MAIGDGESHQRGAIVEIGAANGAGTRAGVAARAPLAHNEGRVRPVDADDSDRFCDDDSVRHRPVHGPAAGIVATGAYAHAAAGATKRGSATMLPTVTSHASGASMSVSEPLCNPHIDQKYGSSGIASE